MAKPLFSDAEFANDKIMNADQFTALDRKRLVLNTQINKMLYELLREQLSDIVTHKRWLHPIYDREAKRRAVYTQAVIRDRSYEIRVYETRT